MPFALRVCLDLALARKSLCLLLLSHLCLFRLHLLFADDRGGSKDPMPAGHKAALQLLDAASETVFTP